MPMEVLSLNALDYVILAILTFGMIKGWQQGLVLSLFRLFGAIVAAVATKLYYPQFVSLLVRYTPLDEWFIGYFKRHLGQAFSQGLSGQPEAQQVLPFGDQFSELGAIYERGQGLVESTVQAVLVERLTLITLNLVGIVLLFFGLWIVIQMLATVLNLASKLPLISSANRFGGLAFGFLLQYLLNSIGLLLIVMMATMGNSGFLTAQLSESLLLPYFTKYNLLAYLTSYALLGQS